MRGLIQWHDNSLLGQVFAMYQFYIRSVTSIIACNHRLAVLEIFRNILSLLLKLIFTVPVISITILDSISSFREDK